MSTTEKPVKKNQMLAFFPWLSLDNSVQVGNWELIPVSTRGLGDSEGDQNLKQVLKPYHQSASVPIREAVLLKRKDKGLFDVLSNEERSDYFLIGEILAFCAVARREFFSHGRTYTNSSSYALTIQGFTTGSDGIAVESRRRDGSNLNYIPGKYNLIIKPHFAITEEMQFDDALTVALLAAQEHDFWGNLHESIFCYLRANSDDAQTQQQAELMFAMGAFERLFDIGNGNCGLTADAFVNIMKTVLIEEERPQDIGRQLGRLARYPSTREAWLRDFCTCRGDMAHGRTKQSYQSIWSPQEHLLLSANIFPIALKAVLESLGFYKLTDTDRRELFYFDKRLREANLYADTADIEDQTFGWAEARKTAVWEWPGAKEKLIPKFASATILN